MVSGLKLLVPPRQSDDSYIGQAVEDELYHYAVSTMPSSLSRKKEWAQASVQGAPAGLAST
jgi:hypothetical protein